MATTRKGAASGTRQRTGASFPSCQLELLPAELTPDPDSVPDCADPEIEELWVSLPQDPKTLVNILKFVISKQLNSEILPLNEGIVQSDKQISGLEVEVYNLKDKVCDLEAHRY